MKAFFCAAVLLLALVFPSLLSAATITFEESLTIAVHAEAPSTGVATGFLERHHLFGGFTEWHVPVFDPALGTVEGVVIQWATTVDVTITSDPPDSVGAPILLLSDNLTGRLSGAEGIFVPDLIRLVRHKSTGRSSFIPTPMRSMTSVTPPRSTS